MLKSEAREGGTTVYEDVESTLPRKASHRGIQLTVPETATGRLVENTKVRERTLAKELGKMTS